ncbi:MAG TPA: hypothetical protein VN222_06845 [Novosphingobium sp.]|nr:hypothetical protein [Novosphingobium sp.]
MAKRRSKNTFANGRNKTAPFLMLPQWVYDRMAAHHLPVGARALLFELIRRYDGNNNGKIGLGQRDAADALGVNKDTAAGYFRALQDAGFIVCTQPGGFNMKDPTSRRASEWRLTWEWCGDRAPTKDFLNPPSQKTTVRKNRTIGPKIPDNDAKNKPHRPKNPDQLGQIPASVGPKNPDTYTSSHRQGEAAQNLR